VNRIGKVGGKRILLLQGPMGPFFKRLDAILRRHGARTYRIGFNAGDRLFSYRDNYTPFRGKEEEWRDFLRVFLRDHRIEMIFLFGDCRFYQAVAIEECRRLGIEVFAFEEGYVRPHYVTMERWGVNDFSRLPREAAFYRALPQRETPPALHARQSKLKMIVSATLYYLSANLFHWRYPHYRHHREMSALKEAFYGVRGAWRKLIYPFLYEREMEQRLSAEWSGGYFFVPLQTHTDFQILTHSDFQSIEKFIITVLESFAGAADAEDRIVFKHHPVDRGRKDYRKFIMEQAKILGIEERVVVLYDTFLPTCLKHAKGTVTVNSTVGLTSIGYGTPTITLGRAVYDIDGLTNKGKTLEEFWSDPQRPDEKLYRKFLTYIIENTQLNGSFYGRFPVEFVTGEIFGKREED